MNNTYSISSFILKIPKENSCGKLKIMSSLLCLAFYEYIKSNAVDESRSIIRDIIFLGDMRNSLQWQLVEWAFFFGMYLDDIGNSSDDSYEYIKIYNKKVFEYFSTNRKRYINSYIGLSYKEIRIEVKKRIKRRLSGEFLNEYLSSYCFYKEKNDIEEEWNSIIVCFMEKIYLFYTSKSVQNNDIVSFKNEAKIFVDSNSYKDIAPFVAFEL